MANRTNTGTADLPLKFAKELTAIVNREWENGNMLTKVTPVTADLLKWWFEESTRQKFSSRATAGDIERHLCA